MELKLAQSNNVPISQIGSNRTFMELKYKKEWCNKQR